MLARLLAIVVVCLTYPSQAHGLGPAGGADARVMAPVDTR